MHVFFQSVQNLFLFFVNIPEKAGLIVVNFNAPRGFGLVLLGGLNEEFGSFFLGGVVAIVLLVARRAGRRQEIAFGPAMIVAFPL